MDSFKFLRLHDEPCRHFSENQIHQALIKHTNSYMDTLERFYYAWQYSDRIVKQPRKDVFTTQYLKGDWRVMPCMINHFEGRVIKAVKVIGTNEEQRVVHDKIAVGKALLINPSDNFVEAIFDVCALSAFRTAALSILAYKHSTDLMKPKLGLVGAGRIGFYTIHILHQWLGIKGINVYDINRERISELKDIFENEVRIKNKTLAGLCETSNVLFLATTSEVPIFKASEVRDVTYVSSVGADADNLSELDKSMIKGRSIISESRQNIYFADLRRWQKAGLIKADHIIELKDIIGRPADQKKPVVFVSTGTAVHDALICQFLFDRLKKR